MSFVELASDINKFREKVMDRKAFIVFEEHLHLIFSGMHLRDTKHATVELLRIRPPSAKPFQTKQIL
jgi:hypothetical protein